MAPEERTGSPAGSPWFSQLTLCLRVSNPLTCFIPRIEVLKAASPTCPSTTPACTQHSSQAPSTPCSGGTATCLVRLAFGPREPPPHWPGASLPPPCCSTHTCLAPPGRWGAPPSPPGASGIPPTLLQSISANPTQQRSCQALQERLQQEAPGGRVVWGLGTRARVHSPALPFQVLRPRASHSAPQSHKNPVN